VTEPEDRRARVDALFDRALDVPAEQRAALLAAACGDEPALRQEVEELLRLAAAPAGQLDPRALASGPLWQEVLAALGTDETPAAATTVGRWCLLGELGRGGMGVVHLAERADGELRQRAALKLLHGGFASPEAMRRFEQERQILANLDHPRIARLLDGGRADDGRPFFVMELVDGRPIDRYCDEERLTVRERLRLFLEVGGAVEHAHRALVVHRDLKPSNIVVTDGGDVKLLDFGIAKLLQPDGQDEQLTREQLTRTLSRPLTPEYASPEQVLGRPITVGADVYQLGLLLYELLVGRRAYRVPTSSALEIERVVCHVEPRRPSAALHAPAEESVDDAIGAEEIAARRRTSPRALARQLRGDLDTIVLEALRKEPERRYPSVARLVDDVERYLGSRPITARGDSIGYRAARFAVRHRLALGAAAAVFVLLAGWAITATRQGVALGRERDRARAEATKARQVKGLVLRLFARSNPEEARGEEVTARELLDRGWAEVEEELAGQPEVQVELLETVGRVYRELGLYDRARPRLDRALALARGLRGDSPLLATVLRSHGQLRRDLGELDGAREELREALKLQRARFGAIHPEVAETLSELAHTRQQQGDLRAGEALFRQALTIRRGLFGAEHVEVAESLSELGSSLRRQGRYAEAEPMLREALEQRRLLLPPHHPQIATSLSNLALVLQNLERLEEAEPLYREALQEVIAVRGESHPYVAVTMNNLARLLRTRGALGDAETLLRRALAIRRTALGPRHPQVAMNLNDLGRLLDDRGDLAGAEASYREALAIYAPDHAWRSTTLSNLGRVLEARHDYRGAERAYCEALADQRARYGNDHERVGVELDRLGIVLHRQGDFAGAEASLREALEVFRKALPENHTRLAEALVPLGQLLVERGRAAEAEPLLREALAIRSAGFGAGDRRTAEAAAVLRRVLLALGRRAEAETTSRPGAGS